MTLVKTLGLASVFALLSGVAFADQNTDTTQTTLNFDATNKRIGINTATPRSDLEVSGTTAGTTLLLAPSVVTPTATVTGTLAMNSNGQLGYLANTTTGLWTKVTTPTTLTFVPAN